MGFEYLAIFIFQTCGILYTCKETESPAQDRYLGHKVGLGIAYDLIKGRGIEVNCHVMKLSLLVKFFKIMLINLYFCKKNVLPLSADGNLTFLSKPFL